MTKTCDGVTAGAGALVGLGEELGEGLGEASTVGGGLSAGCTAATGVWLG